MFYDIGGVLFKKQTNTEMPRVSDSTWLVIQNKDFVVTVLSVCLNII